MKDRDRVSLLRRGRRGVPPWLAGLDHALGEGVAVGWVPASGVAVAHLGDERDHAGAGSLAIVLGLTSEREVGVLRPGEPEYGHLHAVGVVHAIPDLLVAFVIVEGLAPAVLGVEQMAAAVGRDTEGEARVEADDRARDDAAPGDAHHADLGGVDLRERAKQRVREHRVGERVIHPLFLQRELGIGESAVAGRTGERMPRPGGSAFHFVLVHVRLAFDRDTDGREALGVPFLDPFFVGRATAAVDKHHARDLAVAFGGQADPSEDARRLPLPG